MGLISLIMGLLGIPILLVAFIPFLGWLNWMNNFFVGIGWMLGLFAFLKDKKNILAIIGLAICSIVLLFGFFRLLLGGGFV